MYISEIESREEKSKVLFDFEEDTADDDPLTKQLDQVWAKDDLTYLEENTRYVKQREKEIHQIVQSISDLNTIFKELASMVTEQVRKSDSIGRLVCFLGLYSIIFTRPCDLFSL